MCVLYTVVGGSYLDVLALVTANSTDIMHNMIYYAYIKRHTVELDVILNIVMYFISCEKGALSEKYNARIVIVPRYRFLPFEFE